MVGPPSDPAVLRRCGLAPHPAAPPPGGAVSRAPATGALPQGAVRVAIARSGSQWARSDVIAPDSSTV